MLTADTIGLRYLDTGWFACTSTEPTTVLVNFAARLVYSVRRSEHVSPLQELHWLRVTERINFRLAVLVYRCMNGTAPRYLGSELQRVADIESRIGVCDLHRHRRCMFHGRCTRPSAIVPSPLPLQKSGTRFRRRSRHYRHCRLSSAH